VFALAARTFRDGDQHTQTLAENFAITEFVHCLASFKFSDLLKFKGE
jgi:hypothetical protein